MLWCRSSSRNRAIKITNKRRLLPSIALAAAGLGLAPLAKKAALTAGSDAFALAIATAATAATIAVIVMLARSGPQMLSGHPPKTWKHVFLVGAMGSGAVVLLAVLAMTETTATNRSLFQSMYPVATALAARLLLGERLDGIAYLLIAVMSGGLFMMNTGPSGLVIGRAFWLLAATLPLIGLADVYAKRTLARADPGFVVTGRFVFGVAVLLPFLPATGTDDWSMIASLWPWVLAAGSATAAGVLGLYRAMDTSGASLAAAFVALAPALTAAAEWLLLGTGFSTLQLAGLAVVVLGAAVLAYRT